MIQLLLKWDWLVLLIVNLLALSLPVVIYADENIDFGTPDSGYLIGRIADISYYAQSFTPSADAVSEEAHLGLTYYAAAYPDDVLVSIQADTAGAPSGTPLETYRIDGTTLPTGACNSGYPSDKQTIPFSVALTNGVTYWIVFVRDGADRAPNNNPHVCANSGGSGGAYYYLGSWHNEWSVGGDIDLFSVPPPPPAPTTDEIMASSSLMMLTSSVVFESFMIFIISLMAGVWIFSTLM